MSKLSEKIKAASDGTAELYDIPEWGVKVEIKSMTARSRAHFVGEMGGEDVERTPERIESLWWHIILTTCYDPDTGERVFDDEDRDFVFEKNALVVENLANKCLEVAGLTQDAEDDMGKDSSDSPTEADGELLNDDSASS